MVAIAFALATLNQFETGFFTRPQSPATHVPAVKGLHRVPTFHPFAKIRHSERIGLGRSRGEEEVQQKNKAHWRKPRVE
ncbi:hypothetical protein [Sagittula salina]|uniref:hypothetical protein n=1 Tax=Sagittula salina TaxID=2820268 RepID=UPI001FD7E51A|nr:hypothetical protein [Sagittula salina]